jgi:hypothetical protein
MKDLKPEATQHDTIAKTKEYLAYIMERVGLIASEYLYKKRNDNTVHPKRIIGQGTYGCVTLPSVPCEDSITKDYTGLVSKVLSDEEAKKEIKEGKSISSFDVLVSGTRGEIDARYKYGVYALDKCAFPLKDSRELKSFNEAKDSQGHPCMAKKPLGSVVHLEMAAGDLAVLKTVKLTDMHFWYKPLRNILEGYVNMHNNSYYHLDAKPNNMLWFSYATDGIPVTTKINDFGLTLTSKDPEFLQKNVPFKTPWFNFPPASFPLATKFFHKEQQEVIINARKAIEYFSDESVRLKSVPSSSYNAEGIANVLKSLWHLNPDQLSARIDLYGFAIALDNLIFGDFGEQKNILNIKNENLRKVIEHQIHLLARFINKLSNMEYSSVQALKAYDNILVRLWKNP